MLGHLLVHNIYTLTSIEPCQKSKRAIFCRPDHIHIFTKHLYYEFLSINKHFFLLVRTCI